MENQRYPKPSSNQLNKEKKVNISLIFDVTIMIL